MIDYLVWDDLFDSPHCITSSMEPGCVAKLFAQSQWEKGEYGPEFPPGGVTIHVQESGYTQSYLITGKPTYTFSCFRQ